MNADIPGLEGRDRSIAAALGRYHNRKSEPAGHHTAYSSLNNAEQTHDAETCGDTADRRGPRSFTPAARHEAGALPSSMAPSVCRYTRAAMQPKTCETPIASAELFEKEFHVRLYFRQSPAP